MGSHPGPVWSLVGLELVPSGPRGGRPRIEELGRIQLVVSPAGWGGSSPVEVRSEEITGGRPRTVGLGRIQSVALRIFGRG